MTDAPLPYFHDGWPSGREWPGALAFAWIEGRGMIRSTDRGLASWLLPANAGLPHGGSGGYPANPAYDFNNDPRYGTRWTTYGGPWLPSTQCGASAVQPTGGVTPGQVTPCSQMALSFTTPHRLWCVCGDATLPTPTKLYQSDDAAASWTALTLPTLDTDYQMVMGVAVDGADTLYATVVWGQHAENVSLCYASAPYTSWTSTLIVNMTSFLGLSGGVHGLINEAGLGVHADSGDVVVALCYIDDSGTSTPKNGLSIWAALQGDIGSTFTHVGDATHFTTAVWHAAVETMAGRTLVETSGTDWIVVGGNTSSPNTVIIGSQVSNWTALGLATNGWKAVDSDGGGVPTGLCTSKRTFETVALWAAGLLAPSGFSAPSWRQGIIGVAVGPRDCMLARQVIYPSDYGNAWTGGSTGTGTYLYDEDSIRGNFGQRVTSAMRLPFDGPYAPIGHDDLSDPFSLHWGFQIPLCPIDFVAHQEVAALTVQDDGTGTMALQVYRYSVVTPSVAPSSTSNGAVGRLTPAVIDEGTGLALTGDLGWPTALKTIYNRVAPTIPPASSLSAPNPTAPVGGAAMDGNGTFQWDPVTGATSYEMEVCRDTTFNYGQRIYRIETTDTSVGLMDQLRSSKTTGASQTIYWRVRAIEGELPTAWCSTQSASFLLQQIALSSPANGASVSSGGGVTHTWASATDGSGELFELANDSGFTSLVVYHTIVPIAGGYIVVGVPTGTYYWRVGNTAGQVAQQSQSDDFSVTWSATRTVTYT